MTWNLWPIALRALLEGNREESLKACDELLQATFRDPEGMFHVARQLTYLGEEGKALQMLGRSVDGGFFCYPAMVRDPWLDPLRGLPEFTGFLHKAQELQREAIRSFVSLGGDALLGMHAESY